MNQQQLIDQQTYRMTCVIFRKDNVVHHNGMDSSVAFTGKSVNEAKRFVRKHGGKSYTIRS